VNSLSNRNKDIRLKFCPHFQRLLPENPDLPNKLLLSDEVHFHFHGTVNKQNSRYSSASNPHELHQRPFYDSKIPVWCAVWSTEVSGPYFFEYEDGQVISVISKVYTMVINDFLAQILPPNHNFCFQQDGVTVHTGVTHTSALRAFVSSTGDFSFR
jgi:hypothetical protein